MRSITLAIALLLLALSVPLATADSALPCSEGDKECATRALRDHPARKLAFWKEALAMPLSERIGAAPPGLVEILALDNIKNGYPERPRLVALTADFLADVRRAMQEIPRAVMRPFDRKLSGIYFVADIGGTGFTDAILDERGSPVAGFVVLDPSVLSKRTANDWATWKENTPFKPQAGYALAATIERAADDNRKNAIQYILLHELGHVLSIGANVHPRWDVDAKDVGSTSGFGYFSLSWTVAGDRYASVFDKDFGQRKDVVYYWGAKLAADQMLPTYEALERTNFPTLYAATHPADDFAEAFASYVHAVVMKRPFEIRILRDGKTIKVFGSCWSEKRCEEKRKILEELLAVR
jgi:hypothetical protein